jgi:hypothetical protein
MGDSRTDGCPCSCHTGPYARCDIPGGCSTEHQPACVTCTVYRPDKPARLPNWQPVCDGDRALLDRHHLEIGRLVTDLVNPERPVVDTRRYEHFGVVYFQGGIRHTFSRGMRPADPLAALGGVAPINSRPRAPMISGSREAPIPIQVSRVDLSGPARIPALTDQALQWPDDQAGFMSAATVLDLWCRGIRDALYPGHQLPADTVDVMVGWLRARLPEVCDRYPAVADYAREVKDLRGALRAVAGESEPPPERCDVPCQRCDLMTLFRQPDGDVECVNSDCCRVYQPDEYTAWVQAYSARQTPRRHTRRAG